jgi:acyl-CoA synthetase (AMP-forming)/AMP-acid ligase II
VTTFNLADLFEQAADAFGERECLVANGQRRTYAQMEERANRLAHHLAASGVRPGDHVGIYALNCVEWVETLWAVFKIRAVWVNINYRYVEDELRYLFANADLRALVFAREFAPRVAAVRDATPDLAHAVVIDDGSGAPLAGVDAVDYEAAMAKGSPERDFGPRSGDDRYILYTGGTTGMPKGVVWRHEDVFYALGGGIDQMSGAKAQRPEEMLDRARAQALNVYFATAPLMHGASQWAVMGRSFLGGKTVLAARFDADDVWRITAEEKVEALFITGDAMARPLADTLAARGTQGLESLKLLTSTAAVFSPTIKDEFFEIIPSLLIVDGVGASEVGGNGVLLCTKGNTRMLGGGPTFKPGPGTVVLDEQLRVVEPGSGVVGKIARTGHIPLEYYKDARKSAETFFTAPDGRRYSMPGDFARVEPDGQITLLGRGSVSINSGGEKIYPEEVEHAIKSHPACFDAIVIGVPDERWGSKVAAIVQPRAGASITLEDIQSHCRGHIAGFKIPRQLTIVPAIERSPAGKPDYRWAAQVVTGDRPR